MALALVQWDQIGLIAVSWVITLPAAAIVSAIVFDILRAVF